MPRLRNRTKILLILLLICIRRRDQQAIRRPRRWWVHSINQKRNALGEFFHLIPELRDDDERHFQYFRMKKRQFDRLLAIVRPYITFQDTKCRKCIKPAQRLAICLRYVVLTSLCRWFDELW